MNTLKRFLAALAAAAGLQAHAGTYTDLWWNPQESGWGLNVVQQLETAFVTMFVYGPDGKPTWYVASNMRIVALGAGNLPIFGGELHKTTGPFHGGAFDPSQVTRTFVGMLSLQALSNERLRVQYEAEGVTVVKEVVRSTFSIPLGGSFHGSARLRQSLTATGAPFGSLQLQIMLSAVVDDQGILHLSFQDDLGRRCDYTGPYAQNGRLGKAGGTFMCTPGVNGVQGHSGTFELSEVEVTAHGVTGFLRTASENRFESGHFAAAMF